MLITGMITGCQQEKQTVEKTTTSEKKEEPKNEVIACLLYTSPLM